MNKGFTLLEVIIAMFVLTLVVGGVFSLLVFNQRTIGDVAQQTEASYLAEEGIELVRNLRDANFLAIRNGACNPIVSYPNCWKGGAVGSFADLKGCTTALEGCQASYDTTSPPYLVAYSGAVLLKDTNGMYNYNPSGNATPFKRKIIIDHPDNDTLDVNVEVLWEQQKVVASTKLYNWLELPPPARSNGSPNGTLAPGTPVTLALETDQDATCRYSMTANTRYDPLSPNAFSPSSLPGGTSHSKIVGVLPIGTYTYYVRCQGNFYNTNVNDFIITFSVVS